MKRITLLLILTCSALVAISQHKIVLTSGKTIKEAKLFKEHPTFITYERRFSLHDIDKSKISYIETDSALIKYQSDGTAVVRWKYAKTLPNQNIEKGKQPQVESILEEENPQDNQPRSPEQNSVQDYRNASNRGNPLQKENVNVCVSWLAAGGVGLSAGAAGALAGVLTGLAVDYPGVGAGVGFGVGTALGTAIGASMVGEVKYGRGGFVPAFAGSMIGTGLAAGLTALAVDQGFGILMVPAIFLPATGAVVGYRLGLSSKMRKTRADLSFYPVGSGIGITLCF